MAKAMLDQRLPSQPQSAIAYRLVPNYSAWWQRHKGAKNLPRIVTEWRPYGKPVRTVTYWIVSPTATPCAARHRVYSVRCSKKTKPAIWTLSRGMHCKSPACHARFMVHHSASSSPACLSSWSRF